MSEKKTTINVRQGWPQFLKDDRLHLKLSVQWLSKRSGLTERRVYQIERGHSPEVTMEELSLLTASFNYYLKRMNEVNGF